ncbi:SLC13 family permease [Actinomadura alba]|uniref:C4-dicarboxylate ABC transporter n=1 Tax=Actinomadura alba TaxID=406431 RepID=A0ABR7LTA0_9ACTN|nr:SLC13 family permease [Actinomadura alba]MBC6468079.1 C4-dicarboxylate ABC transporter [Actinomadura alba]
MSLEVGALLICIAVFAIGIYRRVNVGILLIAVAAAVGVWLAGVPIDDVLAGFPIDLMILLAGVTFYFGVAQANGTVDRLINLVVRRVGHRRSLMPLTFCAMAVLLASMGNPGAALVLIPLAMNLADKQDIERVLMGIAVGTGMSAGGFAPTSTFGIIVAGTAKTAGITLNSLVLFSIALAANLLLLAAAYILWNRRGARADDVVEQTMHSESHELVSARTLGSTDSIAPVGGPPSASAKPSGPRGADHEESRPAGPMSFIQVVTLVSLVALIVTVVVANLFDVSPDIGVLAFGLGSLLILIDPSSAKEGAAKIDWSTILLVGGIITYVGVLQNVGTIDMLGDWAASMSWPLLAIFVLCVIAGLVSTFASTLAMMALLVPLAVPLVMEGGLPGWAVICAIAICVSIVDNCPFSSSGAMMIATTPNPDDRPRLTKNLARWGFSLVVIGPAVTVGLLIVPALVIG